MKPVYQCDFCTTQLPEDECLAHQKKCEQNPNNKTCYTCINAVFENDFIKACKEKREFSLRHSFLGTEKIIENNCSRYKNGNPENIRLYGL